MRVSREKTKQNHDHVVATAAELFRERGFDGVGLADVMKAAGFTHGGFYNHFGSKDDLEAEALREAFAQMAEHRSQAKSLADLLTRYLSGASRRNPGKSCPAAALGGDAARKSPRVRAEFANGLEGMINSIETRLAEEEPDAVGDVRFRAINFLIGMVGGLMLARAVPDDDRLAREILAAALEGCLENAAPMSPSAVPRPG